MGNFQSQMTVTAQHGLAVVLQSTLQRLGMAGHQLPADQQHRPAREFRAERGEFGVRKTRRAGDALNAPGRKERGILDQWPAAARDQRRAVDRSGKDRLGMGDRRFHGRGSRKPRHQPVPLEPRPGEAGQDREPERRNERPSTGGRACPAACNRIAALTLDAASSNASISSAAIPEPGSPPTRPGVAWSAQPNARARSKAASAAARVSCDTVRPFLAYFVRKAKVWVFQKCHAAKASRNAVPARPRDPDGVDRLWLALWQSGRPAA